MKSFLSLSITLILLFSNQALGQTAEPVQLPDVIIQYRADEGALSRKYSIKASEEYFSRFDEFYRSKMKALEEIPFDALSRSGKVDYLLLKNELLRSIYFLQKERDEFTQLKDHLPAPDSIMVFISKRRNGFSFHGKDVAKQFNSWNKESLKLMNELKNSDPLPKKVAGDLADAIGDLREGVEEAYGFYYGYDPDFTWWAEHAFKKLDQTLKDYEELAASHFDREAEADDESGITGNPIGREEIIRRLQFEMISYTPEELIDIANKQFEWSHQRMLEASRKMGFGDNWKEALEAVKQTYVEEGEQPALVKELADEAVIFLEERDLVTIPELAEETWRMVMLSPEWQKIAPFFLGGEVVRIAYPTNTMSHEEKMMSMRGNNPSFSKAVVHHELIPGHHLQQFMNQRYETHRRMFYTPFWTEGWALYWEMVLWNKGFPETPEEEIGMLYWRMHRCARIVFSLNYHLGKWTPQQAIDYLVDKVGHEYANAEAEVRRSFEGNYGPLYQIAYMIGAMQFYSLRLELVESGQMTEKEFHDAILQNNSIPVAMVKALLTDEDLSEDFRPNWKFGDYLEGM